MKKEVSNNIFGLGLWQSASNVINTLNENITTALESLDSENHGDDDIPEAIESIDQTCDDIDPLESYKLALEESQMHHYKLSKELSLIIAEKDAELSVLRGSDKSTTISKEQFETAALLAERDVYKRNVEELECRLQSTLRESNEDNLLQAQIFELKRKLESSIAELSAMKSESDSKEKQKAETIENLVNEYSKLAAESDLRQSRDNDHITKIIKENETLVTRMHALEHSISELADRAVASSSNSHDSHAAAAGTDKLLQDSTNELKDTKGRVVVLEYELKQSNDLIAQLKLQASQAQTVKPVSSPPHTPKRHSTSSTSSSGSLNIQAMDDMTTQLALLQQQLQDKTQALEQLQTAQQHMQTDKDRLLLEIQEAEATGKTFLEKCRKLEKELQAEKQRALTATADSEAVTNNSHAADLAAVRVRLQESQAVNVKAQELNQQAITVLQQQLVTIDQQNASLTGDLAEARNQVQSLTSALSTATQTSAAAAQDKLVSLESAASQTYILEQVVSSLKSELAAAQATVGEAAGAAKARETELTLAISQQSAQLASASIAHSSELAALLEKHQSELKMSQAASSGEMDVLLKQESDRLQTVISSLQNQLQTQQQELCTAQASLIAANAAVDQHAQRVEQLQGSVEAAAQAAQAAALAHSSITSALEAQARDQLALLSSQHQQKLALLNDSMTQAQQTAELRQQALNKDLQDLTVTTTTTITDLKQTVVELQESVVVKSAELAASVAELAEAHKAHVTHCAQLSRAGEITTASAVAACKQAADSARQQALMSLQQELHAEAAAQQHAQAEEAQARLAQQATDLQQQHLATMTNELTLLTARLNEDKMLALHTLTEDKDKHCTTQLALHKEQAQQVLSASLAQQLTASQRVIDAAEKAQAQAVQDLATATSNFDRVCAEKLRAQEALLQADKADALQKLRQEVQVQIDAAVTEKDEYLQLYTKENKLRKAVHNKLLELQGNIRVVCRVRPILEVERRSGEDVDVTGFPSDEDLTIQRDAMTKTKYEYDRVFAPGSRQDEVFVAVQPLCVSVLDGYNVCIFAYGQTGSGKTYTMEGYNGDTGVSPRAVQEVFRVVAELESEWTYNLSFSMLEIYNETILDLLDSNAAKEKLEVRQSAEGGNVVAGLQAVTVTTAQQVAELMQQGQANRAVGSHDMNEHSSRSHSILTITCKGRNKLDGTTTFGKLHLIDLAGSERVGKTDATGDRLKEAQNINKSLSALGDVIAALGNKKTTHVPYRNSKLTFLLQDSLGGNSKVMMFVNISPAVYNLSETVCSLNFASRCRSVELGQARKQLGSSGSAGVADDSSVASGSARGSAGSSSSSSTARGLQSSASSSALSSAAAGAVGVTPRPLSRTLATPATLRK